MSIENTTSAGIALPIGGQRDVTPLRKAAMIRSPMTPLERPSDEGGSSFVSHQITVITFAQAE